MVRAMKPANQNIVDKESTAKANFWLKNLLVGLSVRVEAVAELDDR